MTSLHKAVSRLACSDLPSGMLLGLPTVCANDTFAVSKLTSPHFRRY